VIRARLLLTVCWLVACADPSHSDGHVPLPALPPPPAPADKPLTSEKAELGRHLFYDTRLSLRGNLSCASCHQQERAFSDRRPLSEGTTGQLTHRNSQSLVNSAYASTLTFANFVLTDLERQALVPLFGEDPVELGMNGQENLLLTRLRDEPRYLRLFNSAFPEESDPFQLANVLHAIACFERTLVSARSAYDRWIAGDAHALSERAQDGLRLFESNRLACVSCHGGPLFSSAFSVPGDGLPTARFENNGLYANYPVGNRGLYELTGLPEDEGRFRPPSLRNIDLTAPYMHDGSLASLDQVIAHYERGGAGHPKQSPAVRGFSLSESERSDLLSFLRSLTDEDVARDLRFSDPWKASP
jgi:cytochrome c peroxidase